MGAAPSSIPMSTRRNSTRRRRSRWPAPRSARRSVMMCRCRPSRARWRSPARHSRTEERADGHADFYTVLLMHADRLLAPLVPESTSTAWRRDLARIVPEKIYRRQPTDATTNNWNLVAAAGEWMRTRAGLGELAGVGRSVTRAPDCSCSHRGACTGTRTTRWPTTTSRGCGRSTCSMRGTVAATQAHWRNCSNAAAWMSLFMQSPNGDAPCGGRSAHHQWNEAQQAVTFESWATRFARRGDEVAARACKHGAILSRKSLSRWTPAVRRTVDRQESHGPVGAPRLRVVLVPLAVQPADRGDAGHRLDQGGRRGSPWFRCPADVGRYAFSLQPAFHKVFVLPAASTSSSTPAPTCTTTRRAPPCAPARRSARDDVGRRQFGGGVSPAVQADAIRWRSGPEWRDRSGAWHALADHGREDLAPTEFVRPPERADAGSSCELTYRGRLRGGASAVVEQLLFKDGRAEVEHRVEGDVDAVRQCWPMLGTDGEKPSNISVTDKTATVERGGGERSASPR